MHDIPREKLSELLAQYGHSLCDDSSRLEALLKDVLRNEHRRETFVLISALREGVATDLRNSTSGMPLSAVATKLVRQLRDNLALDETAARWGVESWAFALGLKITQPVVRVKKPAPPVVVPSLPPTVNPGSGIDLAAMVVQQHARDEEERKYSAEIHQQARELADDANDFEAAIQLLDSLDPKWRDPQLYASIRGHLDQELESQAKQHAAEVHRQAKRLAEQTRDFATAARMMEKIEPQWRDAKLYEKICGYRDQVNQLDAWIQDAVQKGRLRFLRGRVQDLLKLQPNRDDMRRLLDVLPDEPELPKEFTNAIGMRFVLVPAGEFMMGSNEADEGPAHLVRITQPFYLGVVPVTQAEYRAMTGQNPSQEQDCPRNPVEQVTWNEANVFADLLSQLPAESSRSVKYRLPTEAEWEYACRAGSTGKWCFGDQVSQLQAYAWYERNSRDRSHPVGELKANAWGLRDMHGNVEEWCLDWDDSNYYEISPTDDPSGPSSSTFDRRVCRGGCFQAAASDCHSASRFSFTPPDGAYYVGFRVAAIPTESIEKRPKK